MLTVRLLPGVVKIILEDAETTATSRLPPQLQPCNWVTSQQLYYRMLQRNYWANNLLFITYQLFHQLEDR